MFQKSFILFVACLGLAAASPLITKREAGTPNLSLYGQPIAEAEPFFVAPPPPPAPLIIAAETPAGDYGLPQQLPPVTLFAPLPVAPIATSLLSEYGPPPALEEAKPLAVGELKPEPIPDSPAGEYGPPPAISIALPVAEEYGPPPPAPIIPPPAPALPELPTLPEIVLPVIPEEISAALPVALEVTEAPTTTTAPVLVAAPAVPIPTGPYPAAGPVSHYGEPHL